MFYFAKIFTKNRISFAYAKTSSVRYRSIIGPLSVQHREIIGDKDENAHRNALFLFFICTIQKKVVPLHRKG